MLGATNSVPSGGIGWADSSEYQHRRLLASILLRALADATGQTQGIGACDSPARVRASARLWIASDDDDPEGFAAICDQLGIARSVIRRGLGLTGVPDLRVLAMLRHGDREKSR